MVLLIVSSSIFVSSLSILGQSASIPKSCFSQSVKVSSIPETHLYHKKTRPLVIGHHGNPSKFQENTVDGFKSLVGLKADGMELDTFLTKDKQLVVIHYDNTVQLTKQDHNIWDTTYAELQQLDLPTSIQYGKNAPLKFDKTRKIPLLSDVIKATKDDDLVMYLNIKPGYLRDRNETETVGEEVAKLVTDLGVVDKVLLSSFDPFKILAAKRVNPSLVVGSFYKKQMWDDLDAINVTKSEFGDLPNMKQCVEDAPTGRDFMNVLFQSGALLKSTNGSFVVMDYKIFNNKEYSSDTFQTFKDNYSKNLSFGSFIIDNLALSKAQREKDDEVVDLLIENHVSCLVTDDIPRLLKKLGRGLPETKGFASKHVPTLLILYAMVLLVWLLF